jgi:phenylacetate-CoA ligase
VPGYNTLYREAGVKPEDIKSLDDIRHLPFTTKELLRPNLKDFTARNLGSHQLLYVSSSGSTGIPFGFYRTELNRWMELAFLHSGWELAGWQLGDSLAVLRGSFVGTQERVWKYDSASRNLILSSYYLTDDAYAQYVQKIEEYRPLHLHAYPSGCSMLADLVLQHNDVGQVEFKTILLGSENLYPWQKDRIRLAFPNSRIHCWYGHSEQTVLAPWCEHTEDYHVWPFYGVTEIVGEGGREVDMGQSGEIVGTSFWNLGVPFIRYKAMDKARKVRYGCSECGRQFLIIDVSEGRLQEFVVTRAGRRISLTGLTVLKCFDNVRQCQFYQDTPGAVTLRIVCRDTYTENDTIEIHRAVSSKLVEDMKLDIALVDTIPRTSSGKLRFLEQKLNLGFGD